MLYFDKAGFSSKLMKYVKFKRIEKELYTTPSTTRKYHLSYAFILRMYNIK